MYGGHGPHPLHHPHPLHQAVWNPRAHLPRRPIKQPWRTYVFLSKTSNLWRKARTYHHQVEPPRTETTEPGELTKGVHLISQTNGGIRNGFHLGWNPKKSLRSSGSPTSSGMTIHTTDGWGEGMWHQHSARWRLGQVPKNISRNGQDPISASQGLSLTAPPLTIVFRSVWDFSGQHHGLGSSFCIKVLNIASTTQHLHSSHHLSGWEPLFWASWPPLQPPAFLL